jgi:hypothetical protein
MQLTNTQIGIIAGVAITGVVVYYFVKKGKSNTLPAGKARFAKCKNGTTVKITNDTPCANKGGIESIFVADDTQTAQPSKPNILTENVTLIPNKPLAPTKPLARDVFVPINIVDPFANK